MLFADIILSLVAVATATYYVITRAPRPLRDAPRDVLICVAHSDDCVIIGSEYAYGAIQKGLSVKIVYLTCSGPHPDSEISRIREKEALAAWSALGVPEENFTFVNLAESPLGGNASYSDQDLAHTKEIFTTAILSLPKNAAVLVPAEGESHIDHRTVRRVALQALVNSKREDLLVYESPEYNGFLSLVHGPQNTIRTVLRHIPQMRRVIKPYSGPANYVNGPAGFVFRDTPSRLAKKKELLIYFASQDGQLLLRFFGYETLYRRLSPAEYLREPTRALCVPAFGGCCDFSALAFALTLLGITLLTSYEIARGLTTALAPMVALNGYVAVLGVLLAGIYAVRRIRRTVNLETSLFVWAAASGLILSAL